MYMNIYVKAVRESGVETYLHNGISCVIISFETDYTITS